MDTFHTEFGMGSDATRDDALKKAREHADEYFGTQDYHIDVAVDRVMTIGGKVSHHMVTVHAAPAQ